MKGKGIGRDLMAHWEDDMKRAGYGMVMTSTQVDELTVVGGNDRAYYLYESLGFKECGRIPKANKYQDGTYADDIHMVKEL